MNTGISNGKGFVMKLADYLKQEKMTASAFAALIGVSTSTTTRWLTSGRTPDLSTMIKIEAVTKGAVRMEDFAPEHEVNGQ